MKDFREEIEVLDLLPMGIVHRCHLHHQDQVAILTDADVSHHGFVGSSCPGLCYVLSVDNRFEVRLCRHGGCSDKECKPES